MFTDRYGNVLTTESAAARDAYVTGIDLFLGANSGAQVAFEKAISADPGFALAHAALARVHQVAGRGAEAKSAIAPAEALAEDVTPREKSHIAVFSHLVGGRGADAYRCILAHVADYPRDAMIVQPCTGVFGLIGFSGQSGREALQLAFMTPLAPHYGDDWWFAGQYAFAEIESGRTADAEKRIARSLAGNPRNANSAHIKAHVHYEQGEADAGFAYLEDWTKTYETDAPLYCHVNWHLAIWSLERGDADGAFRILDTSIAPGAAWGPPINVLSDTAAFLFRAELAGLPRRAGDWAAVSDYAARLFPNPGLAFADMHAALAHAMAGNAEPLQRIITDATGPAGDLVRSYAEAFRSYAQADYAKTIALLAPTLASHERIGGSRAQRDLLEYAYAGALLRSGRGEEAERFLALHRPVRLRDPANPLAASTATH